MILLQEHQLLRDEIRELYLEKNYPALRARLLELEAIDIAYVFEDLTWEEFAPIYRLLPKDLGWEVFVHLSTDLQTELINHLENPQVQELLSTLYNDDLADILEEVPAYIVKRLLQNTKSERRDLLNRLLQYPEDSAGSIMTTEYMALDADLNIAEALQCLRHSSQRLETIYTCYVTSKDNVLEGVISVRDIFASPDECLVQDVMESYVVHVHTLDDREEVALLFDRYDFLAVPVCDSEQRLVGIVTIDDAIDVMREEAQEDLQKMAAVTPAKKPYLDTTVWQHAKARIPWLTVLLIAGIFNARILGGFESAFLAFPALVSYIPMLNGTSGNAGSQSSAVIIRSLALNEISFADWGRTVWKELRVAVVVGLALALANSLRIYFFSGQELFIAVLVSVSLFCSTIIANLLGSSLPLIASRLNIDPALMAGPLIASILDSLTLLTYLSLARVFFSYILV